MKAILKEIEKKLLSIMCITIFMTTRKLASYMKDNEKS